jgi:hypothetical protein
MVIPKSKVVIRRRYIVDCDVCEEAIEPLSGGFATRQEAEAARGRHLADHCAPPDGEHPS